MGLTGGFSAKPLEYQIYVTNKTPSELYLEVARQNRVHQIKKGFMATSKEGSGFKF